MKDGISLKTQNFLEAYRTYLSTKNDLNYEVYRIANQIYKIDHTTCKFNIDWNDWSYEDGIITVEGWPDCNYPTELYSSFPIEFLHNPKAIEEYRKSKDEVLSKRKQLLQGEQERWERTTYLRLKEKFENEV